ELGCKLRSPANAWTTENSPATFPRRACALRNKCRGTKRRNQFHTTSASAQRSGGQIRDDQTTKLCPVRIAREMSSPCDSSWRGQDWWKGAFLSELIGTQRAILAILCADKSWLPWSH